MTTSVTWSTHWSGPRCSKCALHNAYKSWCVSPVVSSILGNEKSAPFTQCVCSVPPLKAPYSLCPIGSFSDTGDPVCPSWRSGGIQPLHRCQDGQIFTSISLFLLACVHVCARALEFKLVTSICPKPFLLFFFSPLPLLWSLRICRK